MHRIVQDFIREHNDWREILAKPPYLLKINEDEKTGLLLLSYSDKSDFSIPLVRECRGLILDRSTLLVVSVAFDKFFNYGEELAAKLDWSTSVVTQKMDGSLVTLYWHDGKWNLKSNSTIDAANVPVPSDPRRNFRQLFDEAVKETPIQWDRLDHDVCYSFELMAPENRIVIEYPKPQLCFILARNRVTGEEIDCTRDNPTGVPTPKTYEVHSLEDCVALVNKFDAEGRKDIEGLVARDAFGNRVKIKTDAYLKAHYMIGERMTARNAIRIVRENEGSEFLSYSPWARDYIRDVESRMEMVYAFIAQLHTWAYWRLKWDYGDARKSVAQSLNDNKVPAAARWFYFAALDGKIDDLKSFWNSLPESKVEELIRNNELLQWLEETVGICRNSSCGS